MPRKSLIEGFLNACAGFLDELFGEEAASSVAARSRNAGMSGAFEDRFGRCRETAGGRRMKCKKYGTDPIASIRSHVRRIYEKLHAHGVMEAARKARDAGVRLPGWREAGGLGQGGHP